MAKEKALPKHKMYKSAEYAFIEEGYTCKAIADMFDITETTLSRWRKECSWDEKRTNNLAAPHKIREILLKELRSVAEGNNPKIDTDALAKIGKVVNSFGERTSIHIVMSVFKLFDNFMAENDPQMAIQFLEWHKKYLHYRAKIDSM
jgi:transposase